MKNLKWMSVVALMGICVSANAEWYSKAEDDIFSGGKKAYLGGVITPYSSVVFDCAEDGLSMSYIQKGKIASNAEGQGVEVLVKVDDSAIIKMPGVMYERNAEYWGVKTDSDKVITVLKALKAANSKFMLGLVGSSKFSTNVDIGGSTKATIKFAQACKLDI